MKGVLRLEIEKHQTAHSDSENISESGSVTNDSIDPGDQATDSTFQTSNSKWSFGYGKEISGNGSSVPDFSADDVSAKPFWS